MATVDEEPPGDVRQSDSENKNLRSYAALLRSNLPAVLNKNVIEIMLEKDFGGSFNVSVQDCARALIKLGINPGVQVESVQICPNGRGVVYVTLKPEIPAESFCQHDVIQVTESGIRVVQVKPSGKRDVIVTLKGIHPNTRDDGVMDYLTYFGKITSTKVVKPVFGEGPLKGLGNGDRMYKLELSNNRYLGTYHIIDGQRVTVKYRGQPPTCARCFCSPQKCPGNGLAKRCEQAGGLKKDFNDYILNLWDEIGYVPSQVELDPEINEIHDTQESANFTPNKSVSQQDSSKFNGVRVSSFPKDADNGQIVEFLVNSGLPEERKDDISIKRNGAVIIDNLPNYVCMELITAIHDKLHFGRRLYCNGVVPRTPDKSDPNPDIDQNEKNLVIKQGQHQQLSNIWYQVLYPLCLQTHSSISIQRLLKSIIYNWLLLVKI